MYLGELHELAFPKIERCYYNWKCGLHHQSDFSLLAPPTWARYNSAASIHLRRMPMSTPLEILSLTTDDLHSARPHLIELLRDAVEGGASVGFIAPLDPQIADSYWAKIEAEVAQHQRIVLAARAEDQLVGCVQLSLATPPNGTHRADLQKLLVYIPFRGRGIAKQLLHAADAAARAAGKTLLVLDTERGSAAETLYARYGYVRVGVIPEFALDGYGHHLIDTVVFYRLLK